MDPDRRSLCKDTPATEAATKRRGQGLLWGPGLATLRGSGDSHVGSPALQGQLFVPREVTLDRRQQWTTPRTAQNSGDGSGTLCEALTVSICNLCCCYTIVGSPATSKLCYHVLMALRGTG